jgi:hypothetical protein
VPTSRTTTRTYAKIGATLGGLAATASLAVGGAPAHAQAAPTPESFHKLRVCESGDNYRSVGHGYYGAYQFDIRTWRGLGYGGRADQASPATQDDAARRLYNARGWYPWPACSRKQGLA